MGVNTTKVSGNTIMVTGFTADDWYLSNDLPGWDAGLILHSIIYKPSGANDVMVIRNSNVATTDAAIIVEWKVGGDTEEQVWYAPMGKGVRYFPYIDHGDNTYNTASNVRVIFHFL